MKEPIHFCPHCRTAALPERLLLRPAPLQPRQVPLRPEWHCNQCGRTFAPDYFDNPS